mgnify:CR=1 FL=1
MFFYPSINKVFFSCYFVTIKQKTNRGLNFGYDIRTVGPDLFYGDSQNWYQSLFTGALMFRPYYRFSAYDLNVSENNTVTPWTVFPNPSSNVLFVQKKEELFKRGMSGTPKNTHF